MSASQDEPQPADALRLLEVAQIRPNKRNPRLVFPQEELDRLADSIDQEGVLVPISVYQDSDQGGFVLIDGERRFRCALTLGLESIPALISPHRTEREILLQMFNIHLIREPWRDMPTAKALGNLVEELHAAGTADIDDKMLKELTGLSIERVRQLRYVLTLPSEWQEHIASGKVPLNYFWELKRNISDLLEKQRPELFAELGGEQAISKAFVDKRLEGVITDTVGLRKMRPIINWAAKDAEGNEEGESVLDQSIREVVQDPDLTIDDVYEDTVQTMVEADKLERRTRSMLVSFERLLGKARSGEERDHILGIGRDFVERLSAVIHTGGQ